MAAEKPPSRVVTNEDLEFIDRAIANHEACQGELYKFRMILGQVGKIDSKRADLIRGAESEQARLDEVHQKANAAQATLDGLQQQIVSKQRELAAVEKTIEERRVACDQLNGSINNLRNILAAA
jgi:peptidoglycan hydrolase CwlO-like protein